MSLFLIYSASNNNNKKNKYGRISRQSPKGSVAHRERRARPTWRWLPQQRLRVGHPATHRRPSQDTNTCMVFVDTKWFYLFNYLVFFSSQSVPGSCHPHKPSDAPVSSPPPPLGLHLGLLSPLMIGSLDFGAAC